MCLMKTKTIKEIEKELSRLTSLEDLQQHTHYNDPRKGVQKAFKRRQKMIKKNESLRFNYEKMCIYENDILTLDANALICGIDEVGRGPLAGPVIASAVVLEANHQHLGINDSKKLGKQVRAQLNESLKSQVRAWAIGEASPKEIDELNIYEATKLAMYRAIENLNIEPTHYLIDAMHLEHLQKPQQSIIKGDATSVSIAAASIIAKEYRDTLMTEYDLQFPQYDFKNNAGYGTKKHLEGLKQYGVTPIHRQSFEPIKSHFSL